MRDTILAKLLTEREATKMGSGYDMVFSKGFKGGKCLVCKKITEKHRSISVLVVKFVI